MKIETLIEKIQTYKHNPKVVCPDDITEAIKLLISRLEGMLPDVETARSVATKLTIQWTREPQKHDAVLAWAWTVWPLYYAHRIGELLPIVQPLLPAGQPFGKSEILDADCNLAMATLRGNTKAEQSARARKGEMVDHNVMVGGGAPATPDPVRKIRGCAPRRKSN